MTSIVARQDPALVARVVSVRPLHYTAGPDTALDRPAHVRAGSSLARLGDSLVVFQDDANFVALIDPRGEDVRAVPLPVGQGGLRLFDDRRGNKRFKLDLEACVAIPYAHEELLLAFGSGSSPLRERVAVIWDAAGDAPDVALHDAARLYAALRGARDFAGSDLNVEGAVFLGDRVRLFGRGNGAARDDLPPIDATCDLAWPALWEHLLDPLTVPPPRPAAIVQYQLGAIGGLRLSFTDAAAGHGLLIFSAAAEDSPDATRDGPVAGSALGVVDSPGRARWTELRDQSGGRFSGKVEGVTLAPETPARAYVIVDRDDPDLPSELCEVELAGPWAPAGPGSAG